MRPDRRRLLLAASSLLLLAGCQTDPPHASYPELTYGHRAPLSFDVARIRIEDSSHPTLDPPHVEQMMPLPPATAAKSWARDRLRAAGIGRSLVFTVREAAVIETPLETSSGVSGLLTVDQAERYDAKLVVEVQILDDGGQAEGSATVTATRSATAPEDATVNQREAIWFALTEKLMRDVDQQLEATLRTYFGRYLLR